MYDFQSAINMLLKPHCNCVQCSNKREQEKESRAPLMHTDNSEVKTREWGEKGTSVMLTTIKIH